MSAGQPLRRPLISGEPAQSRIAANIFSSSNSILRQEQVWNMFYHSETVRICIFWSWDIYKDYVIAMAAQI